MKVGIIGSGVVGQTLAAGFAQTRPSGRDWNARSGQTQGLVSEESGAAVKSFAEAATFGDLVVLAVGGEVAQQALTLIGSSALQGKTVIDACNPIGGGPPVNGVLSFFTPQNQSLMEQLQKAYPSAHFVKAFNPWAVARWSIPNSPAEGRPCSSAATTTRKKTVERILDQFGWDTEDMGAIEAARPIEALCMLWCIPGIGKNDWYAARFQAPAMIPWSHLPAFLIARSSSYM